MLTRPLFCLAIVLAAGTALLAQTPAVTLYVETTGNDAWNGTLPAPNAAKTDGPVATLARARDLIRDL